MAAVSDSIALRHSQASCRAGHRGHALGVAPSVVLCQQCCGCLFLPPKFEVCCFVTALCICASMHGWVFVTDCLPIPTNASS